MTIAQAVSRPDSRSMSCCSCNIRDVKLDTKMDMKIKVKQASLSLSLRLMDSWIQKRNVKAGAMSANCAFSRAAVKPMYSISTKVLSWHGERKGASEILSTGNFDVRQRIQGLCAHEWSILPKTRLTPHDTMVSTLPAMRNC